MATRKQVIQRATELRVTIIDTGETVEAHAPHGHIFSGGRSHSEHVDKRGWTKPELWAEMMYYMEMGVEKCDDPNCDACAEEPGLPYGVDASMALTPVAC